MLCIGFKLVRQCKSASRVVTRASKACKLPLVPGVLVDCGHERLLI